MDEQSVEASENGVEKPAEPNAAEGPNVAEEPEVPDQPKAAEKLKSTEDPKVSGSNKKIMFWVGAAVAVVAIVAGLFYYLLPKIRAVGWISNQMIAVYIAVGLIGGSILAGFLFRKPLRTRLRMQKVVRDDPDINDWLIVFSWTPKVLYVPTIIASFVAAILSCFDRIPPEAIGGIWTGVFFINFLVEEYNISIKILLIAVVGIGFFLLWLHLLGWVMPFLRLFQRIALSINATFFLVAGLLGLFAILVSWLRGLFYYVTITPNYMNLQEGPTESGEQIGREDYNSRIDTSDFLERLMGFGRIVITFREDRKREPIVVLVWQIQSKAQMLERVRGKLAIDQHASLM